MLKDILNNALQEVEFDEIPCEGYSHGINRAYIFFQV